MTDVETYEDEDGIVEILFDEEAPTPESDGRVAWHLKKALEHEEAIGRISARFDAEIEELTNQKMEACRAELRSYDWHNRAVELWHRAQHAAGNAKLGESFPYGSSKLGNLGKKIEVVDEEAFRTWCAENNLEDALYNPPSPRTPAKAEIKKLVSPLRPEEPGALLEVHVGGEPVPGIRLAVGHREHKIKGFDRG